MKLTQRIAMGYYKAKIKSIAVLSPQKAAAATYQLFCTPYSGRQKVKAPPIFHHAAKLSFKYQELTIRGYRFSPKQPNGKRVLIVHGFDSYCYKFEKYIDLLQHKGFEVLAFDAPAHGQSDGKIINALIYAECIAQIAQQFGPLHSIVAHSLGALASTLYAEQQNELKKMVLIAPATESTRALDYFFQFIPLGQTIKQGVIDYIEAMAGKPLSFFSANRAVQNISIPTLWLHDEDDTICPYADTLATRSNPPQPLQFIATKGLGHNKIYRDEQVQQTILQFLCKEN